MAKFILGQKIKMSQIFDEKGNVIPATLVLAGPVKITQIKNKEQDGYEATQIGFLLKKRAKKTDKGKEFRYLREFKAVENPDLKRGDAIDVSIFAEGDKVAVSGITKSKGFQ